MYRAGLSVNFLFRIVCFKFAGIPPKAGAGCSYGFSLASSTASFSENFSLRSLNTVRSE